MGPCERVEEALAGVVTEGASSSASEVEAIAAAWSHLVACARCRASYDAALALVGATRGEQEAARAATAIGHARVLVALRAREPRPAARALSFVATPLAAACACVALWIVARDPALQVRGDAPALVVQRLCGRDVASPTVHVPPCAPGDRAFFAVRASRPGGLVMFAQDSAQNGAMSPVRAVLIRPVWPSASPEAIPVGLDPGARVAFVLLNDDDLDGRASAGPAFRRAEQDAAALGGRLDREALAARFATAAAIVIFEGDEEGEREGDAR